MNLSHGWLARAGFVLLALTNAVMLSEVAYNREGSPEAVLALTNRELAPRSSSLWPDEENKDLSLQLVLRAQGVLDAELPPQDEWETLWPGVSSGPIAWLDRQKLAALGFDVTKPLSARRSDAHYDRMGGRAVYLVLEFDGPTGARALQAARDQIVRESIAAGNSKQRLLAQERLQRAQEILRSDEYEQSRLFIVDAGLDPAALRGLYADRAHYAIIRGDIKPVVVHDGASARLYGAVTEVRCENIHVPVRFRPEITGGQPVNTWNRSLAPTDGKPAFTVQMGFGRLLEPWIVSAHAGAI